MQFTKLLFINGRRGLCEQALGTLRLREGDHIADRRRINHHGNNAVKAESKTAVRRRTELESVEQEAKLLTSFFRTDLQCGKNLFLNIFAVDTDGAPISQPFSTQS